MNSDDVKKIFGNITPPSGMGSATDNPVADLAQMLGNALNIFLTLAGLVTFLYLLWGAFDWITSNGEKERVQKAQNKITNAVVGLILIFVIFSVFGLLAGDLLGIFKNTPQGWEIRIPTLK